MDPSFIEAPPLYQRSAPMLTRKAANASALYGHECASFAVITAENRVH